MKKTFSTRSKFVVVIVLILCALILILGLLSPETPGILNTVFSPVRSAAAYISNGVESLYNKNFAYDDLEEENRQLKIRVAELEEDVRSIDDLEKENERLKKLLNFSEQTPTFEFASASVVSRSSSNWSSNLTLSFGTVSPIETGDCVITEEGFLIGIITEVGSNWATVTTLVDSDAGIGAKVASSGATCVALGDLQLMKETMLKASYFSNDSGVHVGDTILTSGAGGIYPPDVVIGTVASIESDPATTDMYTVIEPSADLASVTDVYVITAF